MSDGVDQMNLKRAMKKFPFKHIRLLLVAFTFCYALTVLAATTIDVTNHFAFGANVGWIDWRGNSNNGAVVGTNVCSGYIYSANLGWINLGAGSPVNGKSYQNNSATDFGVNVDTFGNLTGYAYGANIGWIAFEANGAPKVSLNTGKFSGHAYSANCGWISLSNSIAFVQTGTLQLGSGPTSEFYGLTRQAGGSYFLYGAGTPNVTYTVFATTNIASTNWISIGTVTSGPLGAVQFTDPNASQYSRRFYKISYP